MEKLEANNEQTVCYTAEHHALLFGLIAKSAYNILGTETEIILRDAVIRYGMQRGKRMRLRAERDGLPICMATYLLYREYQLKPGQFRSVTRWNDQGDMADCAVLCPWAETWRKYGLCQYASVYCRYVDASLGRGFGPNVRIESMANLTDGASNCEIWFRDAGNRDGVSDEGLELDRRARLPWAYHLAHIYRVCRDTLEAHAGSETAEQILCSARGQFQRELQQDDACAFLNLCGADFESIGDYGLTPHL